MLCSKEIDTINNSDVYHFCKDLCLSEKPWEDKQFWAIQWTNGLRFGQTENAIKFTLGKMFAIPLDFDFFKHSVYPHGLKEDLIVKRN